MKRRRSPQEKKRLSLKKDRRNTYGKNDKATRRLIPLRKAKANRALRRGVKVALAGDEEAIEAVAKTFDPRRWRKLPDKALGDIVKTGPEKHARRFRAKIERRKRLCFGEF